jgi:putative chitinase
MILFNRKLYFDSVRDSLFYGKMSQQQVDGQEYILDTWEDTRPEKDTRWLAYCLATTIHETASTMAPIEEYGKGKGQPYGIPDEKTGETYYGRGFVQLTWKENYAKMTPIVDQLFQSQAIDLVKSPAQALEPHIAAAVMFEGMERGSFRSGQTLARYFDDDTNDAYGAREIINGDKKTVPSWSNGVSIGELIKSYHEKFLDALLAAYEAAPPAPPVPMTTIEIIVPEGVEVVVTKR